MKSHVTLQLREKLQKGNMLIISTLLLMLFIIAIPNLVKIIKFESKMAVKQKRSTVAFHLAEAGLDMGYWKLSESASIWQTLESATITNYNFDKLYTDVSGGEYMIRLSSHPTESKYRILTSVGRDTSNDQVRKIEAIYEKQELDSAIWCGPNQGIDVNGNVQVHWGPIKSMSPIDLTGAAASAKYPRKYSTSSIDPWDTDPGGTNTDNLHWWTWYTIPPRPDFDFDVIEASATAVGKSFSVDKTYNGWNDTSNHFWYFGQDLEIKGQSFVVGKIFVMGDVKISGGGKGNYTITQLPVNAADEYEAIDTTAAEEWFGDTGGGPPSNLTGSFEFGTGGNPDKDDGVKEGTTVRGLLYCAGQFTVSGDALIHGALIVDGNSQTDISPSGGCKVFYDETAYDNLPTSTSQPTRVSWRELPHIWP